MFLASVDRYPGFELHDRLEPTLLSFNRFDLLLLFILSNLLKNIYIYIYVYEQAELIVILQFQRIESPLIEKKI